MRKAILRSLRAPFESFVHKICHILIVKIINWILEYEIDIKKTMCLEFPFNVAKNSDPDIDSFADWSE